MTDSQQPVAKKGKISVQEPQQSTNQQSTNQQSRSGKTEPNARVDKRLKTDDQLKSFETSTSAIGTRNKIKSSILPSSTTIPLEKKESRKLEVFVNKELGRDFVKSEPIVNNCESVDEKDDDKKLIEPFAANESVQHGFDDVEHVFVANDLPASGAALTPIFGTIEPHIDAVASFAGATSSDQLQHNSLESNEKPEGVCLKMAEGIEHVLFNDHSHDSGVNTLSCSSPACQSTLTALDGSQKTDLSETQSEHSAFGDVWECKDIVSDPVLIESGESSIGLIDTHLPEAFQKENDGSTSDTCIDYPTISIGNFLAFSGLINKAELPSPSAALANRLHREAGGKLRRCIKTYREPQMVYRRVNSGGVDSVAKINSIDASVLNSEREFSKVSELKRMQSTKSRFSQFLVKDSSVSPVKSSDVKNSIAEVSAVSSTGVDISLKKVDNIKTSSASSYSPVAKNDFKKPKVIHSSFLLSTKISKSC